MQDAKAAESLAVSMVRSNDDEDDDQDDVDGVESEGEETQRHVDFAISEDADYEGGGESGKPNRLHRRDTPHHLKNKRIHGSIDKDKVASIIAQVSLLLSSSPRLWSRPPLFFYFIYILISSAGSCDDVCQAKPLFSVKRRCINFFSTPCFLLNLFLLTVFLKFSFQCLSCK